MKKREEFIKMSFSRVGRAIKTGLRILAWQGLAALGLFFLGLDAIRIYIFKRF
jgi:hypothetical protein